MIQGWELALIIFAITVMVVNVVNVTLGVKLIVKFDRLFDKSAVLCEKLMDKALEDLNDE